MRLHPNVAVPYLQLLFSVGNSLKFLNSLKHLKCVVTIKEGINFYYESECKKYKSVIK